MEYNKLSMKWQIGRHLLQTPSQRSLVVIVDLFLVSNIFFVLSMVSSLCLLFTIFSSSCAWSFSSSSCSQAISFHSSSHHCSWSSFSSLSYPRPSYSSSFDCSSSFLLIHKVFFLLVDNLLFFFLLLSMISTTSSCSWTFSSSSHDLLFLKFLPLESILVFVWVMYHVFLLSQQINNVYKHVENYLWPWFCILGKGMHPHKSVMCVLPPTTLPLEHSHLQWQCHQEWTQEN